jgi:hypothetical protein
MFDDETIQRAIQASVEVPVTLKIDLMDALTITTALAAAVAPQEHDEPIWSSGAGLAVRHAVGSALIDLAQYADEHSDVKWGPALTVLMSMLPDNERSFLNPEVRDATSVRRMAMPLPRGRVRRRRAG